MRIKHGAFEAKVDRSGDHHLWLGAKATDGGGQVRVDGRLMRATRVAWIIANGPIPDDARVLSCVDEPACIRIEHLQLIESANTESRPTRARRGSGSIRELTKDTWKIVADAGTDDAGYRRRITRTVHGTKSDANRALAALVDEVRDGAALPSRDDRALTVDDLVDWYIAFARDDRGLDHSTLTGYRDVYDHWLKGRLGTKRANAVTLADLDKAFGKMRQAGLSRSRMNNARAVLSGAYKWGRRHGKVHRNPVDHFELPLSTQTPKATVAPELDDLLALLNAADEHDEVLAPVLKLGATTGLRRGELAGLRRDRLRLDRNELVVDRAVNDAGGVVVEKQTKTRQRRVVSLDDATVEMLRAHLQAMDERAALFDISISDDAYVFSLEPGCELPLRPEFLTRRMRQLRQRVGLGNESFDATILALRKWSSSELMDAGFNPSTVSGRQGHTVQVMLHHYSSRRQSADRAAAQHLGARVFGTS